MIWQQREQTPGQIQLSGMMLKKLDLDLPRRNPTTYQEKPNLREAEHSDYRVLA